MAVLSLGACSPPDAVGDDEVGDRADTLPVEIRHPAGAGSWRLVEELLIDGNAEEFSVPSGFLLVDDNGTMTFADRVRFQLRIYDANGQHLYDFGGRGNGPGEFAGSRRLSVIKGGRVADGLWVYDPDGRRITFVGRDGKLDRTVLSPRLGDVLDSATGRSFGAFFEPLGVHADGGMVGKRIVALQATPRRVREDIVYLPAGGGEASPIGAIPPEHLVDVVDPATGRVHRVGVMGDVRTLVDVSQRGDRVLFVSQDMEAVPPRARLTVLGPRGDTLLAMSRAIGTGGAVTEPMYQRWVREARSDFEGANRRNAGLYSADFVERIERAVRENMAPVREPIRGARLGLDGTIWLMVYPEPDVARYLVLDAAGDSIGYIVPPVPHPRTYFAAGSRTHVWALVSDQDWIPSIVRYRIEPAQ
jgi:hypothetical protein